MDEHVLLRRTREDVAPIDDGARARARARLMVRTQAPPARARRGPRVASRVALGVGAAAVAGVVAGVGLWPGDAPPAGAATLLHRAADAAGSDPAPGPGQYLAVETREQAINYLAGDDSQVVGAILGRTVSTTFVPHDPDESWVLRTGPERPVQVFGAANTVPGGFGASTVGDLADQQRATARRGAVTVQRAVGGFGNGELGGGDDVLTDADLAALPRDPHALLRHFETTREASRSTGAEREVDVVEQVSALLRSGRVPRDLRSAMYDALALLPDVVVVADQTTLDGRTGTAIGVRGRSSLDMVVIDTGTGDYLGQREVQTAAIGPVPVGTVIDQTSVRVSVVDDVPR